MSPPDAAARNGFGEFLSDYFNVTAFSYTGDLSVGGFASFSGSLSFEESGGETLVAASGVNVQLGSATSGVQITGASFGLVLPGDGTYALEATGSGADRHPRLHAVRHDVRRTQYDRRCRESHDHGRREVGHDRSGEPTPSDSPAPTWT